jgi:hypothetical protein
MCHRWQGVEIKKIYGPLKIGNDKEYKRVKLVDVGAQGCLAVVKTTKNLPHTEQEKEISAYERKRRYQTTFDAEMQNQSEFLYSWTLE